MRTSFQEFLTILTRSRSDPNYQWHMSNDRIRALDNEGDYYCPVTFVAKQKTGKRFRLNEYFDAGLEIGLRRNLRFNLGCASEYNPKFVLLGEYIKKLRQKILKALGLRKKII